MKKAWVSWLVMAVLNTAFIIGIIAAFAKCIMGGEQ